MFPGSQVVISGGTISQHNVNINGTASEGFKLLQQAVSPSAFHDSGFTFNRSKCHPKTRLEVFEEIMKWMDKAEGPGASAMWMKGSTGVGKSAISRTLAERVAAQNRLVASYFFSRTDPSCNSARPLVANIAYHASRHIPQLRADIAAAVEKDPLMFNLSLETQFSSLLTQPFRKLAESGYFDDPSAPSMVIIDGLDECIDRDAQVNILNVISTVLLHERLPLRFFIASRAEQEISITFSTEPLTHSLTTFSLDHDKHYYSLSRDIRFYLEEYQEDTSATYWSRIMARSFSP